MFFSKSKCLFLIFALLFAAQAQADPTGRGQSSFGQNVSNVVATTNTTYVYGVSISNAPSNGYLFVFNGTSLPPNGTVTAGTGVGQFEECWPVSSASYIAPSFVGGPSEYFSAGVVAVFSSTGCGTLTATSVGSSGVLKVFYQ